jgi:hypothetical protein
MRTAISASTRYGWNVPAWVFPGHIREVTAIDLRWRFGLRDLGRSVLVVWRALSSRHANPFTLGGDRPLEFRVRDLGGQAIQAASLAASSAEIERSGNRGPSPKLAQEPRFHGTGATAATAAIRVRATAARRTSQGSDHRDQGKGKSWLHHGCSRIERGEG